MEMDKGVAQVFYQFLFISFYGFNSLGSTSFEKIQKAFYFLFLFSFFWFFFLFLGV